jgi:hypothetical protein
MTSIIISFLIGFWVSKVIAYRLNKQIRAELISLYDKVEHLNVQLGLNKINWSFNGWATDIEDEDDHTKDRKHRS